MKQFNSLARTALLSGMFFFLVISSCKKSDDPNAPKEDDPCGEQLEYYSVINAATNTTYEELNGSTRTLILEDPAAAPDDICAQEHSQATFSASSKESNPIPGLTLKAKTYWFVGRNKVDDMPFSTGGFYVAEQEIGMLDAFGKDKPGYAGLQIIATFPTQGTLEADKTWLDSKFSQMKVHLKYKKFKAK
jgi:hypothetical protein